MLKPSDTSVPVSELGEVNLAGVYSFGRGLFKRGRLSPAETSYSTYNRLMADDLVISQPKAWEGAIARVTREFEGWFLSPVFPTFRANRERLEPSFAEWFCKRPPVWAELQDRSRGMGARRETVHPDQFLSLEIPLPPLPEQRRLVARIEDLAARIEEARGLRQEEAKEVRQLLLGAFHEVADKASRHPMAQIAPLVRRPVTVEPAGSYPELGIRSFGNGTFHKPALSGVEVGCKRIFRIEPGDLIFSNVFAWEGAVAVALAEDAGRVGSHRFMACVPRHGVVKASFLCFFFLTEEGLDLLGAASPGGAGRNRTLGLDALARISVPLPPMDQQDWFDSLQKRVGALMGLQAETAAELDALLPSVLDRAFKGEL